MMVVYATDLDNTLIYSQRFLKEYDIPTAAQTVADTSKSGNHSYIDDEVLNRLISLKHNPDIVYIPVTTRSMSQYIRTIEGIHSEYAIVANGGIILHDDKPMPEWENIIANSYNHGDLLELMGKLSYISSDIRLVDNKIVYTQGTPREQLQDAIAKYSDFICSYDERTTKGYIMPKMCQKDKALTWLCSKLGRDLVVASGDSELDIPMLRAADLAVIPSHSSLSYARSHIAGGLNKSPLVTMNLIQNFLKKGGKAIV